VGRVLWEALAFPWNHRLRVLQIAGVPWLVLAACLLAFDVTSVGESELAAWSLYFLECLATAWLAVGMHRLVLLGPDAAGGHLDAQGLKRDGKFAGLLLATWLLFTLSGELLYKLGSEWLWPPLPLRVSAGERIAIYFGVLAVVTVGMGWLFARICLLFPALAVDQKFDLPAAWRLSRGSVFRLLVITSLSPILLTILGLFVTTHYAIPAGFASIAVLHPTVLIVEVAALSLSYAHLTAPAPPPTDPPA
jgi:hypothetical protein